MHVQKSGESCLSEVLQKGLDWPPVWTALGLVLIWVLAQVPFAPGFGVFGPGLALAFLGLGLWLMLTAFFRMRARGTTVIPNRWKLTKNLQLPKPLSFKLFQSTLTHCHKL